MNRHTWKKNAFSLVELVLAVALAAGPVLLAVNLVIGNVRAARFNQDRAVARMVLLDLATLLLGESLSELRSAGDRLGETLQRRIERLPDASRDAYMSQARPLLGSLEGRLEEESDASRPGLARLTLSAKLPDRTAARVVLLFRPRARERLQRIPVLEPQAEGSAADEQ